MTTKHFLILLLALSGQVALAADVATVIALRGDAILTQSGRTTTVEVGASVEEGAVLRTGSPGRVKLRFIDGSIVVVGDSSSFTVDHMTLDDQGRRLEAGFVLDIGLISQSVAPSNGGQWAVRTPTAVTAVRGTEYLVEVRSNLSTDVSIRSGKVVVEPVQQKGNAGARMRSVRNFSVANGSDSSVVLGRKKLGTSCSLNGVCEPAKRWSETRLKKVSERLSGV